MGSTKSKAEMPKDVEALRAQKEALKAEIKALKEDKKRRVQAAVNIDADMEELIREEYAGGSVNYLQLAAKYRISDVEVRRILGDPDLVEEGTSLNELPAEV